MTAQEHLTGMPTPKQDERTPGPWYHDGCGTIFIDTRAQECCGRGDGRGECCGVPNVVGDYGPIATASKADAEFIVQACNAYGSTDALREALADWDVEDIRCLRRMVPDLDAVMTHNPIAQVYFRAGLLACRETMARFVEQGGNREIAASIRANWWPSLGDDPGAPRQLAYEEVADEQPSGRIEHANTPPSIEALARAWHFLETREIARTALAGVTAPQGTDE